MRSTCASSPPWHRADGAVPLAGADAALTALGCRLTIDQAGVSLPRMRGPRAPVALGTLPGRPRGAASPSSANATASFASPSKNSSSNAPHRQRRAARARSHRTQRRVLRAAARHAALRVTGSGMKRRYASAMLRAVSAVGGRDDVGFRRVGLRVAAALDEARRRTRRRTARGRCSSAAGSRSTDRASSSSTTASIGVPLAREPAVDVVALRRDACARTPSMTTTPGPVSNARATLASAARRNDRHVADAADVLQRAPVGRAANSSASAIGTSGAPCPPAATSRTRKSLTTSMPVRSAITAGCADLPRRVAGLVPERLAVRRRSRATSARVDARLGDAPATAASASQSPRSKARRQYSRGVAPDERTPRAARAARASYACTLERRAARRDTRRRRSRRSARPRRRCRRATCPT